MKKADQSTGVTVASLCRRTGISRQAFYKKQVKREAVAVDENLVIQWVKEIRMRHPRQGTRKLHKRLSTRMKSHGIRMGRDHLFELLKRHNLLIHRRRRYRCTTQSLHRFYTYPNRIRDKVLTGRNQVWVSDITYISTDEGFLYLSLITDAYTRKIVGYEISDSLAVTGCKKALRMALASCHSWERPIHHSDRGIQYCCGKYTDVLIANGLTISMTEKDHCAENALAERINGILKEEYLLGYTFKSKCQAKLCCIEAIKLYNTDRPHLSLNYQIPSEFHEAVMLEKAC